MIGHNSTPDALARLAREAANIAKEAMRFEGASLDCWIEWGAKLNEARALLPGNREFGEWVQANALSQVATTEVCRDERAAAMWAAANPDQLEEAKDLSNARTLRGMHKAWKEAEEARAVEVIETNAEEGPAPEAPEEEPHEDDAPPPERPDTHEAPAQGDRAEDAPASDDGLVKRLRLAEGKLRTAEAIAEGLRKKLDLRDKEIIALRDELRRVKQSCERYAAALKAAEAERRGESRDVNSLR